MKWLRRDSHPIMHFGLCLSEADFRKELKRLKVKEAVPFLGSPHSNGTTHFLINKGKEIAIVCIAPSSSVPAVEVYGLLIHEAVHIWRAHCDSIGEKAPSAEFECYGIQHIATQLIAAYMDSAKKKGKK